jgi:hypothetical protein
MEKKTCEEHNPADSLVLYCLLRRQSEDGGHSQFMLIPKQGYPTFPPTKFRPGEELYSALVRPMEEDLGLAPDSYYPEEELPAIPRAGTSPRYEGLPKQWYLYPVVMSLTREAFVKLETASANQSDTHKPVWWSIDEVLKQAQEPNVLAIASFLKENRKDLLSAPPVAPSMEALACSWAAHCDSGARIVRGSDIRRILDSGSHAFNLRVADPYLPYQKQGLGFTWSFFSPKDKQDVHVHGLPAVEIYGVLEGRLQIWHKPMYQRGVRAWRCVTLQAGDWAEIEPLTCHFACWLDSMGLGTVIKAARSGELGGVGRLGVTGKTTCTNCNVQHQCLLSPAMQGLLQEYQKPFDQRDYKQIGKHAKYMEDQSL